MHLVERIKNLMDKKKLSQYKLGQLSGVPHSTMSTLMSGGIKNPSVEMISKIAAALGVSVSYLLGEDGQQNSSNKLTNSIMSNLKLIVDDEGLIEDKYQKEAFHAIISNLDMTPAFHEAHEAASYEKELSEYFNSLNEEVPMTENEASEMFNKAYNLNTIKKALRKANYDEMNDFLISLESIIKNNGINKPTGMSFYNGGEDLTDDEIAVMESALMAYREQKRKLMEQMKKNN